MLASINARKESTEYMNWVHANVLLTSGTAPLPRYMWAAHIVDNIVEHSAQHGFVYVHSNNILIDKYLQWAWRMYKDDTSILYREGGSPKWVVPKLAAGHRNYEEYADAHAAIFSTDFCLSFMEAWQDSSFSERLHTAFVNYFPQFFYAFLSMNESTTIKDIDSAAADMAAAEEEDWSGAAAGDEGSGWRGKKGTDM